MLQAHSFLWHYFWLAPNVLLFLLGLLLWWKGQPWRFPAFITFAVVTSVGQFLAYAADMLPFVTPEMYWQVTRVNVIVDGMLKSVLIGEIFANVVGAYAALARFGKFVIGSIGVLLIFSAAVLAAFAPKAEKFSIIQSVHLLEQTIFLVESGLLIAIFLFCRYFRLSWGHQIFGIALGLGISACVHLATWALMANGVLSRPDRIYPIFLNMATYHVCVVLWLYYLLVPDKEMVAAPLREVPENSLAAWNRELERLLQQ